MSIEYRIVSKQVQFNTYYKIQRFSIYKTWDDCVEEGRKLIYASDSTAIAKLKLLRDKNEINKDEGWANRIVV